MNSNLLICSSRHSLQYLWPHLVWTGSFSGKWHMGHLKSSSTSSTKSSSWPEEEQCLFDVDSAMLKSTFCMQWEWDVLGKYLIDTSNNLQEKKRTVWNFGVLVILNIMGKQISIKGERSSLFVGFCTYYNYVIFFGVVRSLKTVITDETIVAGVLIPVPSKWGRSLS